MSNASLTCTLPAAQTAVSFEPFVVSDAEALSLALQGIDRIPARTDVSRRYSVSGSVARARFLIVTYDGYAEMLTVLSGSGEAIATGRWVGGTLALESDPLPEPCADNMSFGNGILSGNARAVCTNRVLGFWNVPGSEACENEGNSGAFQPKRRFVVSGALYNYLKRFQEAGLSMTAAAIDIIAAERQLQSLEAGELDFYQAFINQLSGHTPATLRRYAQIARAAFAEKGIFLPALHVQEFGTDAAPDKQFQPSCYSTAGCDHPNDAMALANSTLAAGGPLVLDEDAQPPEFDLYAPPGDYYEHTATGGNVGRLVLSDNSGFSTSAGSVVQQLAPYVQYERVNCAPIGFFRMRVEQATWASVVQSAVARAKANGTEPRVYYRLVLCLDGGGCSYSASGTNAGYTVIRPKPGGGCTVASSSSSDGLPEGLSALLLAAAAWWRLRRSSC